MRLPLLDPSPEAIRAMGDKSTAKETHDPGWRADCAG